METTIRTLARDWEALYAAPQAVGTMATPAPTLAEPIGDGILPISGSGQSWFNYLMLAFFGVGDAAQTFAAKVVGWRQVGNGATGPGLWLPTTLASVTATLGSVAGPAGSTGPILATHKLAGTVAVAGSLIEPNNDLWPSDLGLQVLRLDASGFQKIQLLIGTGSATSGNALLTGF